MKALPLLKHNIDTLLKARHQTRRELAVWVRQSMDRKKVDPWISQIFTHPDREFQMKYLDRIADFFGIAVYQLFQPGISHLTERRKAERRSGQDRRVSRAFPSVQQPTDADFLAKLRLLYPDERKKIEHWMEALRLGRDDEQETRGRGDHRPEPTPPAATTRRTRAPRHGKEQEPTSKRRGA
jgi:hypothetical protein